MRVRDRSERELRWLHAVERLAGRRLEEWEVKMLKAICGEVWPRWTATQTEAE